MSAQHPLLLATAIGHAVLALGHTSMGLSQFKDPSLNRLPALLRSAVKAGWYEGSVFFIIMAILNYKWAQTGLVDGADKAIATILTTLLLVAGSYYLKSGNKQTGLILAIIGTLQAISARGATL